MSLAFWLRPDWRGDDPFWMRESIPLPSPTLGMIYFDPDTHRTYVATAQGWSEIAISPGITMGPSTTEVYWLPAATRAPCLRCGSTTEGTTFCQSCDFG